MQLDIPKEILAIMQSEKFCRLYLGELLKRGVKLFLIDYEDNELEIGFEELEELDHSGMQEIIEKTYIHLSKRLLN